MSRTDGLEPDGLPDAAVGRVPDAAGRDALLSVGLSAVGGVPYGHLKFLLGILLQERRDVEGKGDRATVVRADQLTVHVDVAAPVHSPEVQQDVLAAEGFGQGEGPAIHEGGSPVGGVVLVHDAGEGRLDGERHQDCLREGRGATLVVVADAGTLEELPDAVQVHPFLSLHGWARIFSPDVLFCQLFAPRRHDRSRLLRPYTLCRGAACCYQHDCKCYHAVADGLSHVLSCEGLCRLLSFLGLRCWGTRRLPRRSSCRARWCSCRRDRW